MTISLRIDDGQAHIEFCNPDSELLPEDVPLLFERFYRGEKSRSREHGGAGIGLSLVKELVKAHGGAVSAALSDGRLHIRVSLLAKPVPPTH